MQKQALDGGGWIDLDACRTWKEAMNLDASNMISAATGSQWDHQQLILTIKGLWVLHSWSQWAGTGETYERMDVGDAADWLVQNDYDETDVPELAGTIAALEA
jgi:hypothetical protein